MRRIAALLLLAVPLAGCAQYHIMVSEPERGTQPQTHGSMSAGWGAVREDVIAKNCVSNALAEVRVSRNFGQGLAGFLTFGAWQPATITWYCAKIPQPDAELNLGSGN